MQIDTFFRAFASPFLLAAAAILFLLTGCTTEEAPFVPPVDPSAVPLTVRHFERDLFAVDSTTDYAAHLADLRARYPEFSAVYFRYGIPLLRGDFSPAEQADVLRAFVEYPLSREVYQRSQRVFSDWRSTQATLQTGLANFGYYFPELELPDTLVTFVSQFQYAGFQYGSGQLAAGLDMHLGSDFDYAAVSPTEPIFSDYLTRTYTPEHLPGKMLQLLIEEQVPEPESGRLIDYMVANGKKMYLLDLVFPETPDSLLFEMTAAQLAWLADNETEIYVYLQSEELLYETDLRQYRKYIEPSPNSPGMPEGAPGRSANWLGMRIVRAFVRNNPNVPLADLLAITDGQEILTRSRFKPR